MPASLSLGAGTVREAIPGPFCMRQGRSAAIAECRIWENGAPGTIRTSDPQIRSLMLYPAELRARAGASIRGRDRPTQPPLPTNEAALRRPAQALRPIAMRALVPFFAALLAAACSAPQAGPQPSLAPRAAEAIDPRLPIPSDVQPTTVDPSLASQLAGLVGEAQAGVAAFDARQATAERLASAAGPMASESWVVAEQALSLLVEQHGVTTQAAANIDKLGSSLIQGQRWIRPADQQAISSAASEVAAISGRQAEAIDRLKNQLAR
jgi:hypothetical protein